MMRTSLIFLCFLSVVSAFTSLPLQRPELFSSTSLNVKGGTSRAAFFLRKAKGVVSSAKSRVQSIFRRRRRVAKFADIRAPEDAPSLADIIISREADEAEAEALASYAKAEKREAVVNRLEAIWKETERFEATSKDLENAFQ